ncbi:hypothetical protein C8R46DRAFT_478056 [Mycena filopes]|nr:hypothetical protein C8R46DRAFT_478043 [Mycena filopes]KAJ7152884.1 hypothetical protein C8R46DRAFT_478056 [Mycena filopes]
MLLIPPLREKPSMHTEPHAIARITTPARRSNTPRRHHHPLRATTNEASARLRLRLRVHHPRRRPPTRLHHRRRRFIPVPHRSRPHQPTDPHTQTKTRVQRVDSPTAVQVRTYTLHHETHAKTRRPPLRVCDALPSTPTRRTPSRISARLENNIITQTDLCTTTTPPVFPKPPQPWSHTTFRAWTHHSIDSTL